MLALHGAMRLRLRCVARLPMVTAERGLHSFLELRQRLQPPFLAEDPRMSQKALDGPKKVPEGPGNSPEGPRRYQKLPEGPRRPQRASEGPKKLKKLLKIFF